MNRGYGYIKRQSKRHGGKLISGVLFAVGIAMLSTVTWPMVKWWLADLPRQPQRTFASPVVATESAGFDYSVVRNWYPISDQTEAVLKIKAFTLSIPKLRINSALVSLENDDLKKSLVGWKTGGVPGQSGTAIVFGHSALPQFYDPKNYLTIFSLLPTLTKGDQLYVNYDGVSYKYKVFEMQTVIPEDFSVLEQKFDDSYISLITCVPPGTYWKRLIVRARLVNY